MSASEKFVFYTDDKYRYDDDRQNIRRIKTQPIRQLRSRSRIRFFGKFFPSPAALRYTKQQIDERTERKGDVTDEKIFQVEDARTFAERLYARKYIEAECARQRKDYHNEYIDDGDFFSRPAGQIDIACDDRFKDGDNG